MTTGWPERNTVPSHLAMTLENPRRWLGNTRTYAERLAPERVQQMAALLDLDAFSAIRVGDPVPPLWHWLFLLDATPQSALGPDGHEQLGHFLPEIPDARRMWAGSRIELRRPLRLGELASKTSTVTQIEEKTGASGPLWFVEVAHTIDQAGATCLQDTQTIVYRKRPLTSSTFPKIQGPTDAFPSFADSRLMFRYSALTFNGHRIHYDRDYATAVEGYPALVVHGPLLATLAARQAQQAHPDRTMSTFTFRANAPLFDGEGFRLAHGDEPDGTWVRISKATRADLLSARITWAPST